MKILLINTLFHPDNLGGAEFSVQSLALGLKENGHQVYVLATSKKNQRYTWEGIDVIKVYIPNVFWRFEASKQSTISKILWRLIDIYNPFTSFKVKRVISEINPDIIHTNNIAGFSVSIFRLIKTLKIPLVHTTRDFYLICAKSSMFKSGRSCNDQCKFCKFYTYPKKIESKNVNTIVFISEFMKSVHLDESYFSSSETKVIYNSIGSKTSLAKSSCGDKIKYGFFGALRPEKGIEELIEVFSNDINHELIVAGVEYKIGYLDFLKSKSSDNIHFVGFKSKDEFFNSVDVLIHPALWKEPFGRVVVESYSYGKPVIGTKLGGLKEIIHQNRTGFLLDPNNLIFDLENLITTLSKDKVLGMSKACFDYSKYFSNEIITLMYLKAYKRLQKGR
ncbi:glycosyltransferase family 4 protein [Belliella sp. DSM 111904]|uniref:Glycosyltransferase family 4 protein n=1 Tax=Belliella filtrata TaxID=2923435 RepID=A0ABS9V107_9BACT|nr:glycosyltransferase family 4 protein [Belliella filtrata]MCH7409688.1 glycosyltransferase family 4 protein [Belliella filtrata]